MKGGGWARKVSWAVGIWGLLNGLATAQDLPGVAPPLVDEVTDEVRWQSWTAESFKQAGEQDKPVLLSVEARWQYESQYLRVTAYQDRALAKRINTEFVPVRVDADQRPDIVRRYATAGVPSVVFLNSSGLPLKDTGTGQPYGGRVTDGDEVRQWCQRMAERDKEIKVDRLATVGAELEERAEARADVFTDDFVRIILRNIAARYDADFGGYGDPAQRYAGKRPEVNTLRLLLVASELWQERALLGPLTETLRRMAGGTFYQEGFGEVADSRDWNRLRDESTLGTNMALMENYLGAYRASGENYFMEIVYKTMDDTLSFQDVFLRKGFGGAFYSARRAMLPRDLDRGLSRGPMVQCLITPWSAQATRSYFLMGEATQEPRWGERALKALDFLLTEMVRTDGRVAYSLDRDAPGVDTIFAAHPALAGALLEAFQRTSERGYLEQAERLMEVAGRVYWQAAGYYSDVAVGQTAVGLLKEPRVDLDANAQAVEVLLALTTFTGKSEYRERAREILESLAGEAQVGANESAAFAVAVLKYNHSPVTVVIVGGREDPRTAVLRDAALGLGRVHRLVEVVDPIEDAERLAQWSYAAGEAPEAFLRIDLVSSSALRKPEELAPALEELEQRAQR